MALCRIEVRHVRNLRRVALNDLRQVNLFFGRNGGGKTSMLEAIHLLGMARSFRGNSIKPLITHGESSCTAFGVVTVSPQSPAVALGVQRNLDGEARIKLSGKPVRKAAELAEQLPLQVITADSFNLLTGAPGARRRYLDWGVFHVEHRFFGEWQRFQRCIKQRNKLLRRGKISDDELRVWTKDLAKSGARINTYREAYFKLLSQRFTPMMMQLAPELERLELLYRSGWDKKISYEEALMQSLSSDREQGYTHCGPQRADLKVMCDGHSAADTLSRGQQKLLICGLKLVQGQLLSELGRTKCTYLIDDLPSELDRQHSIQVCEALDSMGAQVFITCVDHHDIAAVWPRPTEINMFHVEHGKVHRYPEAG